MRKRRRLRVEDWRNFMLKLIIGLKGSGKTKHLIAMVNQAVDDSRGAVICIERSDKLRFDIKYQCRLISSDHYAIYDAQSLYGFVAGIYASNHDITDVFIDSALRITGDDIASFDKCLDELAKFSDDNGINIVITSTIAEENATETMKKYI